jgi:23S rRNA pseudouridine1911/1915/1917 synthase
MDRLLLDWLIVRFPTASRQTLKRMAASGRVLVNDQPVRILKTPLQPGDAVRMLDHAPAAAPASPSPPVPILYEDEEVLVVDKPPGLLTSTVPREPRPTLAALLRDYTAGQRQVRLGVIHRLDRDASGLLVFSKNNRAYESLKSQFARHTVTRIYLAAVCGVPHPPAGRIESQLVEWADGSVHSTKNPTAGQRAVSDYQVVRDNGQTALVRVTLHTGRKHQIRVHLSERGTPVLGDRIYAPADVPFPAARLMLAAIHLDFDHPATARRLHFEIPPPKELTGS